MKLSGKASANTRKIVFWTVMVGSLAAAFAVPAKHQQESRKTTDPPVAAHGKLGQDLFFAIDHRDLAGVKALIKKGADPNSRNGLEFTPLYLAAASHQQDVMTALLDAGAKPDAASAYGTALLFASATANREGADILFSKGVNVNVTRGDGNTPLMMAANAGRPDLIADLIKHQADVNAKNVNDSTALLFAARQGNVAAGSILVDAGATVDSADIDGQTPLMAAAATGHADFVKMLLDHGANVNARDSSKRTALLLTASYGDYPDVVKTLVAAGADVAAKDGKGRTAAFIAATRGYGKSAATLGGPKTTAPIRGAHEAITLSLRALQASTALFEQNTACISCHQEGLGRMTTAAAQARGFRVDQSLMRGQAMRVGGAVNAMRPLHEQALKSPEAMKQVPLIEINEVGTMYTWILDGMAAQNQPASPATAAMAEVLARQQSPAGNWSFSLPRVPMQSSFFTFTALAVRALNAYGPKTHKVEMADRTRRALAWLEKAKPQTSEDRASRLLGLKWAGASAAQRQKAMAAILADQRPDGGWSQLPNLQSDAYATGQALYALREGGGLAVASPAYKRGVQYLLRTQDDDGSWFVNKRAFPANNYFDAGFPHGESQYSSFNGTCWATLALLETTRK